MNTARPSFSSIDALVLMVNAWDRNDVGALGDILARLDEACRAAGEHIQWHVNLIDLPSEPIPDDVDRGYPVFSMDRAGTLLVGWDIEGGALTMPLEEYRERHGWRGV